VVQFEAERVLLVLDSLSAAGLWFAVDGGWGVDALAGRQTREHEDLDGVVLLDDAEALLEAVARLGFVLDLDLRPTRFVAKHADGAWVDFHPLVFDADGVGWQLGAKAGGGDAPYPANGFTSGSIGGRSIACLTAGLQLVHHEGYEPDAKDAADLRVLAELMGREEGAP